jgi:hypothetical protein
MSQPSALTLPQLRQALDNLYWNAKGHGQINQLTPDQQQSLAAINQRWEELRPSVLADYWPIIDDRIALLTRLI